MDPKIYIEIAVLFIAAIVGAFYITWQIKKNGLKKVAVDLIVYAEKNFRYNEDKFNYCVNQLIKLIPVPFSLFITDTMVEKIVQGVFDLCKAALDYREGN